MKTQKAYAQAMKVLGNIESMDSIDEIKTAIGDVISNIEAHTTALNTESKTHREAKKAVENTLSGIASGLNIEIESPDSVLDLVANLKKSGDDQTNDLTTRLSKLENQLKGEIDLRTQAETKAQQIEAEKTQQTIQNKVSSLLESHNVLSIHRDLLSEKLSRDLKLDSDGDITNGEGLLVSDIVSNYVETNKDSGIIGNPQKPGGGSNPPNGGPTTAPTTVRGNIEAFAQKFQK